MRIVVVRAGALGDFLLSLPALQAIGRCFPDADIHVVGPFPQARLVTTPGPSGTQIATSVSDVGDTALSPLFVERASLDRIPAELRDADVAIAWLGSPETVADNLHRLGAQRVIAQPPFPPNGRTVHVAEWLLSTLLPLGIEIPADWDNHPWASPR